MQDVRGVEPFYEDRLGMQRVHDGEGDSVLEAAGGLARVRLVEDPLAPSRPPGTEGLFHMAFLVPTREDLARVLRGLRKDKARLIGAADHGVSEALYLEDPEGNGIEVYRDRDPETWPRRGEEIVMRTDPLDGEGLLATAQGESRLPEGTRLGHVHLETLDLGAASRFYEGLGLHVTQTTYPGARFLALGSYHHHVGLNGWRTQRRRLEDATGLIGLTWRLPPGSLSKLNPSLQGAGFPPRRSDEGVVMEDPMGVPLRFVETSVGQ